MTGYKIKKQEIQNIISVCYICLPAIVTSEFPQCGINKSLKSKSKSTNQGSNGITDSTTKDTGDMRLGSRTKQNRMN